MFALEVQVKNWLQSFVLVAHQSAIECWLLTCSTFWLYNSNRSSRNLIWMPVAQMDEFSYWNRRMLTETKIAILINDKYSIHRKWVSARKNHYNLFTYSMFCHQKEAEMLCLVFVTRMRLNCFNWLLSSKLCWEMSHTGCLAIRKKLSYFA